MKKFLFSLTVLFGLTCCSDYDDITLDNTSLHKPIKIGSTYPSALQTRATIDGGFVVGDQMGVFVVDYDKEGQPGVPAIGKGRAANLLYVMQDDGSWTSRAQLYWANSETPADFYGYYPFDEFMESITDYAFAVAAQQDADATTTTSAGYAASDLLRAKAEKQWPTEETIMLNFRHMMAGVTVLLEQGTGFSAQEWTELEKTVLIQSTVLSGTVNLANGYTTVSSTSKPKGIVPLQYNGTWRALVFPQTVEAGKMLASITIDGQDYLLKKQEPMIYYSGKMHQFTITVDRNIATGLYTFTLADEAILPWENDGELHEGMVRQYINIHVAEPGTLEQVVKEKGIDPIMVKNLKVSGNINGIDIEFIWNKMPSLTNLNLIKSLIEEGGLGGPSRGWADPAHPLEHIAFPEKGLKSIGGFRYSSIKGTLTIPEGVEETGWSVFEGNPITSISLPSTLKYTDYICWGCPIHGEIYLPEGLITWGGIGGNYTSPAHIPSSLRELNAPLPGVWSGPIVIPQTLEKICDFAFERSTATSVSFPEGMKKIPVRLFSESNICGELIIPSTVEEICNGAFCSTRINKIIFSDGIRTIWDRAFEGCTRLMGTLELPKKITRVSPHCFEGCSALSEIVIPPNILVLEDYSFAGCYSLSSIVCQSEEPPVIVGDAFYGVPKDNFTVEVPKGCVEKYRNTPGWSDFKRIAEYSNFVCRPQAACALNKAHLETLVLNADGPWTVARKPDWCRLSQTSGIGKTQLTVTFQDMPHGEGNRQDSIIFQMTTATGREVRTFCVLSQYDYEHEEDGYVTLQKATRGNTGGIDLVFVGEGYDGEAISNGSYLDLVKYQMECFFAIEPYTSMRDYFNVYASFPLSQEAGVNTMYTYVNNHFGTLSEGPGAALIAEYDNIMQYAIDNTPLEESNAWRATVVITLNSDAFGCQSIFDMYGNAGMAICPLQDKPYPRDTRGAIQHEVGGHAFGKLGDEEIAINAFAPQSVKGIINKMHERGWYKNLATTGKLHDVAWSDYIFDPVYSDRVDVYEGGLGYTRGIYRPEVNSCMNYGIPYYNTPSRQAIYERIKWYAGEEFRMEEFRTQDTFEWGPTEITRATAQHYEKLTPITSGDHKRPTITNFREVGDKVRTIRKQLREYSLNRK
ncbi:MAG: fimbrillin family protein [Prevotella sp.]|nr:fimbrillin family protein [Prevotella sp.]